MIQALRKDKGHFRYCKRAVQAWIEAGSSVRLGREGGEGGREGRKGREGEYLEDDHKEAERICNVYDRV